jgi:predicted transcriptional regulator of viral defense system
MNYSLWQKLNKKLYFSADDVADILGIKLRSAHVLCSRYVKKGFILRLKKNFYLSAQNWDSLCGQDFLRLANIIQVPSYISFLSGLIFYELTTQVQKSFFESASLRRSARFNINGVVFNFYKLKKEYYFDFVKKGDIFIATKEKAFVDAVYLYSLGKYKIDFASLDLKKLDWLRLKKIAKLFPQRTKNILKSICKI